MAQWTSDGEPRLAALALYHVTAQGQHDGHDGGGVPGPLLVHS